jgi:6-phosphogluconolactonase
MRTTTPEVIVHDTAEHLATATAARLAVGLLDATQRRGSAGVVLTGGRIGTAVLAALGESTMQEIVPWRRVSIWWGDERFLPSGSPERNETGARRALLDRVPVPADQIHPMPSSDGLDGDDVTAAAARYARELSAQGPTGGFVPRWDILLLGVGPDGHVASLFPTAPALDAPGTVVSVVDSPKPPPTRISLTFAAIASAEEVWLVAAGDDKAEAVARALEVEDRIHTPASVVRGSARTLWLLDRAAASRISG